MRRHPELFFGLARKDWLRIVLTRIHPALFEDCFIIGWATALRSDAPDLIALDGNAPDQVRGRLLHRSGDEAAGAKLLHLVSAWASTQPPHALPKQWKSSRTSGR